MEECSAALNLREKCGRNSSEGSSGESKNCSDKMSGEPKTA
jgi:hypothetical protein